MEKEMRVIQRKCANTRYDMYASSRCCFLFFLWLFFFSLLFPLSFSGACVRGTTQISDSFPSLMFSRCLHFSTAIYALLR